MDGLWFVEPGGTAATRGHSHVVVSGGALAHVAGQVSVDAAGRTVAVDDLAGQVACAFANLDAVLAAAGTCFAAIAAMTIYCVGSVDRRELPAVRAAIAQRTDRPPAITFVFVAGLLRADWLVEVQAIAVIAPPAAERAVAGRAA